MNYQMQNTIFEWTLRAAKPYQDPFNEVVLDAVVVGPEGSEQVVPAFWAGGDLVEDTLRLSGHWQLSPAQRVLRGRRCRVARPGDRG